MFLITAAVAYFVGWSFWTGQRSIIIEKNCSIEAEKASVIYNPKMKTNPSLGYEYLLNQCLKDNGY